MLLVNAEDAFFLISLILSAVLRFRQDCFLLKLIAMAVKSNGHTHVFSDNTTFRSHTSSCSRTYDQRLWCKAGIFGHADCELQLIKKTVDALTKDMATMRSRSSLQGDDYLKTEKT